MKHPATRELFAYWDDLRAGRSAPERSDIDPTAIRGALADTFMLEVDMSRAFPVRLAGTRVNGLFDTDVKGRGFLPFWHPAERRNVAAVLMTVADGACPVVAGASAAPAGQEPLAFELLFLPLRHHGKTHARILGLIKATQSPAWLGLLPVGPLGLTSLRIVDGRDAASQPNRVDLPEEPLTPSPMHFGAVAVTQRPQLRVIQGGR